MRTVTRLLLTGLLVTATATACSIEDQQGEPRCIDGNTANLVAQSVPTAELVPCFDPLPNGWDVETTRIDQDGTTIRFRSDRAGDDAAVLHYTASCEVGDAVAAISEHAGARRFEFVEEVAPRFRARRYYVFEGGCLWWKFDFDEAASAALSIELGDQLVTVRRDVVNEAVREAFIDEDL